MPRWAIAAFLLSDVVVVAVVLWILFSR